MTKIEKQYNINKRMYNTNLNKNIYETGVRFDVVCLRCKKIFTVIRNWGGGIRTANEKYNPAKCISCGSLKLEVY